MSVDAWLDSTLYEAGFALGEIWENLTIFFRRFRFRGWKKWLFELSRAKASPWARPASWCMLALALPAFHATAGNWRAQDDYAVTFLDRYGNEIGQRGIIQRHSVPVDEMPDIVIKAVLATEDRRFFEHYGIDFIGLLRAFSQNVRADSVVQGGSTITQQLAKNLFLSNERTIERKIKEAFLAVWLEANLTKKEILQLYLDRMYMGGGTFGIAAAADFYFGKNIKDVNLSEAAMLAGLFKAPAKYAPHINLPAARERANVVLTNMVDAGFMTEGQVLSARLHPATLVDRGDAGQPRLFPRLGLRRRPSGSPTRPACTRMIVRTTIDMNMQKAAEESLAVQPAPVRQELRRRARARSCCCDNNGAVRALVGGRDYGESQFNRATKALGRPAPRSRSTTTPPPWSTASRPNSLVLGCADRLERLAAQELRAQLAWPRHDPRPRWRNSFNVAAGAAGQGVSSALAPIKKMAEDMGVESPLKGHKTMVLGTSGMTVMDQATGYLTLATGGYRRLPPRHHPDHRPFRQGHLRLEPRRAEAAPRRLRDRPIRR